MPSLGELMSNPDFLKYLGNAGSVIGQGGGMGQALGGANLSGAIEGRSNQQGYAPLIEALMGQITPAGQKGPTSVTKKVTADGEVITINAESDKNRNTFGPSVPVEAETKAAPIEISDPTIGLGQVGPAAQAGNQSPFFKALLG
jgi:hypothetical protein